MPMFYSKLFDVATKLMNDPTVKIAAKAFVTTVLTEKLNSVESERSLILQRELDKLPKI
jgi:hypothetical protein